MTTKRIGLAPANASWLKYCRLEAVPRKSDRDILNPLVVRWWGMFEPPVFPALDGDIDYLVQLDDRCDSLALQFYSEPLLWWVIAARNDIDDPVVALHAGERIVIPEPAYVQNQIVGVNRRRSRGR